MPWSLEGVLPCRRQLALENDLNALATLDDAPRLAERIDEFLRDLADRDLSGRLLTRLISAFNRANSSTGSMLNLRFVRVPVSSAGVETR